MSRKEREKRKGMRGLKRDKIKTREIISSSGSESDDDEANVARKRRCVKALKSSLYLLLNVAELII